MFVKLREDAGFPKKHTVLGIRFIAGQWKTDIDESKRGFFEDYVAERSNKKLFIVADSPEAAARAIIEERQRKLAKMSSVKEGKTYTDDDLLALIQVQDMQKRKDSITPVVSVQDNTVVATKKKPAQVVKKVEPRERSNGDLVVCITKVVGPVVAGRLASKFGDDLFDVIMNAPNKLTAIDGIGKKKKQKIVKAVRGMG